MVATRTQKRGTTWAATRPKPLDGVEKGSVYRGRGQGGVGVDELCAVEKVEIRLNEAWKDLREKNSSSSKQNYQNVNKSIFLFIITT